MELQCLIDRYLSIAMGWRTVIFHENGECDLPEFDEMFELSTRGEEIIKSLPTEEREDLARWVEQKYGDDTAARVVVDNIVRSLRQPGGE